MTTGFNFATEDFDRRGRVTRGGLRGVPDYRSNDGTRLDEIANEEMPGLRDKISGFLGQLEDTSNRVGEAEAVTRAGTDADQRSARDAAQFERRTRGMDLSPRQKKAASRRLGLSRQLNRASAQGAERRGFADRARAAKEQAAGFADALFNQRLSAVTGVASAEQTLKNAATQRRANKKASTLGLVSSVAGAALAFLSSEQLKDNHGREPALLEKLKKVRVNRWNYKGDDNTHVGPFSEEFNREFGIKTDRPDMINVIDALGVTLGAVKELDEKVSANGR